MSILYRQTWKFKLKFTSQRCFEEPVALRHSRGTISRTRRIPTRLQTNLSFILMKEGKRKDTYLYEKPRCNKGQAAVLSIKSVMVRVEGEVIEVEKSETRTTISSIKRRRAVIFYFYTILYSIWRQECYLTDYITRRYLRYTGTRATTRTLYRSDHICLLKCQGGRVTCDVVSMAGKLQFYKTGNSVYLREVEIRSKNFN